MTGVYFYYFTAPGKELKVCLQIPGLDQPMALVKALCIARTGSQLQNANKVQSSIWRVLCCFFEGTLHMKDTPPQVWRERSPILALTSTDWLAMFRTKGLAPHFLALPSTQGKQCLCRGEALAYMQRLFMRKNLCSTLLKWACFCFVIGYSEINMGSISKLDCSGIELWKNCLHRRKTW